MSGLPLYKGEGKAQDKSSFESILVGLNQAFEDVSSQVQWHCLFLNTILCRAAIQSEHSSSSHLAVSCPSLNTGEPVDISSLYGGSMNWQTFLSLSLLSLRLEEQRRKACTWNRSFMIACQLPLLGWMVLKNAYLLLQPCFQKRQKLACITRK